MKNKIISSYSDKLSGVSAMTIQNKYGRFTGYATYNPLEDIENFSRYAGERYAENRAYAEFAKFRYKQEKIKLKTIQNLIKDIENTPGLSMEYINPKVRKKINLKLRDYSQSVEDWKNLYEYFNLRTKEQIELREKIISRTKENN